MLSYTHGRCSRAVNRRASHRPSKKTTFVLGSHCQTSGIRGLSEVGVASTCKGLAEFTAAKNQSAQEGDDVTRTRIRELVHSLQKLVRHGDADARQKIQNLVVVASCCGVYAHSADLYAATCAGTYLSMDMAPDIYTFLVCAMSPNTAFEDTFVSFLRSSIVFFPAPKRFHRDISWPEDSSDSLVTLLKCCLPSLLSIYPCIVSKDVSFDARVCIFRFFHRLFLGSHQQRAAFLCANRSIVRVCVLEYVYYFVRTVTPLPETRYMLNMNIAALATNAFNVGQQLRVDLNSEFAVVVAAHGGDSCSWDAGLVDPMFVCINDKCKIIFDRNTRSAKGIVNPFRDQIPRHVVVPRKPQSKPQYAQLLRECVHHISHLPFTEEFVVFEAYCRRSKIEPKYVRVLWTTFQTVRVHELTVGIIARQIEAIARISHINTQKMTKTSTLLVCLFCCQFNTFPTFRHDVRQGRYTCNKCEIDGSVVRVNMIGRLVVVCNVPLVLSVPDCKVVVWNGSYQHFAVGGARVIPQILWGGLSNTQLFTSLVRSALPMQYIVALESDASSTWPFASNEFMLARHAHSKGVIALSQTAAKRCCMCRNGMINQRYLLLDVYNMCPVVLCVCIRHTIAHRFIKQTILTVTDYINFVQHLNTRE